MATKKHARKSSKRSKQVIEGSHGRVRKFPARIPLAVFVAIEREAKKRDMFINDVLTEGAAKLLGVKLEDPQGREARKAQKARKRIPRGSRKAAA